MAATVKAGTPKPRPARKPPAPEPEPDAPRSGPLRFGSTPETEPEREPLFYIDGTEYTIPVAPGAYIAINASRMIARGGANAGARVEDYVMTEMLGEEGYAALRACRTVTLEDYRYLVEICTRKAMGAEEESSPPNR